MMKDKLFQLIMMGQVLGGTTNLGAGNGLKPEEIDVTPKEPPIPKGCERYYFNEIGICHKGHHKIFFDAIKKANAFKKYDKWKTALLNSEQNVKECDTTGLHSSNADDQQKIDDNIKNNQ